MNEKYNDRFRERRVSAKIMLSKSIRIKSIISIFGGSSRYKKVDSFIERNKQVYHIDVIT